MILTVVIAALAGGAVAGFMLFWQRSTRARLRKVTRQLEQSRRALTRREEECARVQSRLDDLARRESLRSAAAAAAATNPTAAPMPPTPEPDAAGVLKALWALTALDQARARRFAEALSTAPPSTPPPDALTAGLQDEVGRLREETGTPGTLRIALESEPAPGDAELLLRSVQALLAVLSRYCQGYDLYVHQWEQRLLGILVCESFDGPESVADETSDVLAALVDVGGRLELDRDAEGRLRARLSIPVTTSEKRSSASGTVAPPV